jgi:hypothetical protein
VAGARKTIKLPRKKVTPEQFREMARGATEDVQRRRAAAQIAADSIRAGRSAFAPEDGTREERIAQTMNSALEFGHTYLPHYFINEGAPFHEALDKLLTGNYTQADLERWAEEFGIEAHEGDPLLRLMSIEIFRGGGKSVIANLCDSLRRICHGLDPYLIIAGDTFAQAGAQLEDIKDELGANEKIIQDFGRLKPAKGGQWQEVALVQDAEGRVTWREGQIITTNGVRVDAIGRGGKMRGRRHGAQRPTCAKLDDLDNDENVQTKAQRDKVWNWIMSAVIPALDPERGQVQLIGTTIHFDCAVARASRKKDAEGRRLFTTIKFTAMRRDKDGNLVSNWPARFTTAKLLRIRVLLGPAKFGAEYMNDPRDPDQQLFDVDKFVTYLPQELQGKELKMILYIDPSMGKKTAERRKKSDFIGFAKTKADRKAKISYLVEADRKRLKPTSLKAYAVDWYRRALAEDPDAELWIEENSFWRSDGGELSGRSASTGSQ